MWTSDTLQGGLAPGSRLLVSNPAPQNGESEFRNRLVPARNAAPYFGVPSARNKEDKPR